MKNIIFLTLKNKLYSQILNISREIARIWLSEYMNKYENQDLIIGQLLIG